MCCGNQATRAAGGVEVSVNLRHRVSGHCRLQSSYFCGDGKTITVDLCSGQRCLRKMPNKRSPDEDKWAFQEIGTPFPNHTVRAQGSQNSYVALWYKHGKPLMGQAWNDSGVVQCAFAYENKLLSGRDIGGVIQVLQYEGYHLSRGFFYEWTKFGEFLQDSANEHRQPVRCGNSVPIFWPEKQLLGSLDIELKVALFPAKDNVLHVNSDELASMLILLRNTQGGPPHCPCDECVAKREQSTATQAPRVMLSEWIDCREGDEFPTDKQVIRALGRPLKTANGDQDQFVALWYRHGVPVMGCAWNNTGRIAASFSDAKREYTGSTVGSMSYLLELPPLVAGFDYSWQPFKEAAKHGDKEWHPVHISFISPCVLVYGEKKTEVLGGANLKDEYATAAVDGKVIKLMGQDIQACQILCRKDRDDTASI